MVKVQQRKPFGHMDMGSLFLPLGTTNGTTNAVMFGVALMRHRDPDLSIVQRPPRFDLVHHDMDAPPWWQARQLIVHDPDDGSTTYCIDREGSSGWGVRPYRSIAIRRRSGMSACSARERPGSSQVVQRSSKTC